MAIQTYITDAGMSLIAKGLAGGFPIQFVAAEIGTGAIGSGENPATYNGLKVKYADAMLSDTLYQGGATCKFSAQYSVSGLVNAVLITEIGIYATDPDDGKILFAYTNLGEHPDRLFPSDQASFYKFYDVIVNFSAASGVTVTIDPSALIPASMMVTNAEAGKILRLDDDGKLPTSITGNAEQLGGQNPDYYAKADHRHDNAKVTADGFMSKEDKAKHDEMAGRVNQGVKTTDSPTFAGMTMTGPIHGATFL